MRTRGRKAMPWSSLEVTIASSSTKRAAWFYCDVTLETGPGRFYRIDLVQMLWFRGVRSLLEYRDWRDGLTVLAKELEPYAAKVFSMDADAMDSRYCFPVTREQAEGYFEIQRGS